MIAQQMKITRDELVLRKAWVFDTKLEWACKMLSEFIIYTKGECYLSFSAGKDSQVGSDIVDKIYDGTFKHLTPKWEQLIKYPKPPRVFSNTGNEYPEIVEHARTFEHVQIKPKMGFTRVIKEIGVAVVSKDVAQKIKEIRKTKSEKLLNKRLYGDDKGNGKIPEKWKFLITAPFEISDKCCEVLKKEPFRRYEAETGRRPIIFTTTEESTNRSTSYRRTGCNSYTEGKEKSRPMSVWIEADVWEYAGRFKLTFAPVYYDRTAQVTQLDGSVKTEHLQKVGRTGCVMCLFGVHLDEKNNNRMQKMAVSHPKFHDIVINKCGLGVVLDYIKVPYLPTKTCSK